MKTCPKLVLCLAICVSVSEAANPVYEEAYVRSAYAKLSYAVTLSAIHSALNGATRNNTEPSRLLTDAIIERELHFDLSDFSTGNLSEISTRRYSDLVTKPDGTDVVMVSPGLYTYTENSRKVEEFNAQARWERGQDLRGQDWDIPMARILELVADKRAYTRFAFYTVKVLLDGRARTYRAMFLFAKDAKGEEQVLPLDNVTNNAALEFFGRNAVYPATLLETKLRGNAAVVSWLKANVSAQCPPGKRAICCDLTTLKCGVSADDLTDALNTPIAQVDFVR